VKVSCAGCRGNYYVEKSSDFKSNIDFFLSPLCPTCKSMVSLFQGGERGKK
jgi:hypothetical protein